MKLYLFFIGFAILAITSCSKEEQELEGMPIVRNVNSNVSVNDYDSCLLNTRSLSLEVVEAKATLIRPNRPSALKNGDIFDPSLDGKTFLANIYEIKGQVVVPEGYIASPFNGILNSADGTIYASGVTRDSAPSNNPIDKNTERGFKMVQQGRIVTFITYDYALLIDGARWFYCANSWILLGKKAFIPYYLAKRT